MRFELKLAAGLVLGGLGLGLSSASAMPAMPQPGLLADSPVEQVRMNNAHGSMLRHRRRMHVQRHGHPNARNPERAGHMQQMGNVSGGPRR